MAQICAPVLALIMLCTLGLFSSEVAAVRRTPCCTKYSIGIVPKQIQGFSIQNNQGRCNLKAVILHTPYRKICVNPELRWVSGTIDKLRAQVLKMKNEGRSQ